MKKLSVMVASSLMALTLATGGCGGTGTPDGGQDLTGSSADLSIVLYKLVSGMYTVTSVTNASDGCMIGDITNSKFLLTNSGPPTGMVTFAGFGTGTIMSNMGTLTLSGTTTAGTCTYNYTTNIPFTITADNTFTANYSETDTDRLAACMPAVGTTCTSTWTMTGSM